ncbi:MAG TPA: dihydroorotate dehydrogenase 2 [Actinomycetota bacterium]
MGWYETVGRRAFFALDPERSHRAAIALLALPLPWRSIGRAREDPRLATEVAGLGLSNPIGLAGGFDKGCARMRSLGALGFGYVVGGTITLRPRAGNARPRIARDPDRRALVNAMGLPNPGAEVAAARLARSARTTSRWVSLADEELHEAVVALDLVAPHADAIELNASSPNAGWAHRAAHVGELTAAFVGRTELPVFVKLPPFTDDATREGVLAMAAAASDAGAAGLTCGNTIPIEDVRMSTGRGGLSGGPLTARTPAIVAAVHARTGGALPIHACGGIFTPEDARACLEAGASTVQVYTGLIYEGPAIVGLLTRGLARTGPATD